MKDLKVPDEFRSIFKKPFGEVYKGKGLKPAEKLKDRLKGKKVIVVGDVTLKNVLAAGIKPNLAVIDLKTKRTIEAAAALGENVVKARNPPGMITQELWDRVHEAVCKDGSVILVDGEEDLAVLPCVIEADWNTVVLYGQPDEGIVFVDVTEDKKMEASVLVKLLSAKEALR